MSWMYDENKSYAYCVRELLTQTNLRGSHHINQIFKIYSKFYTQLTFSLLIYVGEMPSKRVFEGGLVYVLGLFRF